MSRTDAVVDTAQVRPWDRDHDADGLAPEAPKGGTAPEAPGAGTAPEAPEGGTAPEGPGAGTAPEALVTAARRLAAVLATRADEVDRGGRYSAANIEALWAEGLGSLTLPSALGGAGADLATTAAAVEAVATGDPATALIWVMHLLQLRALSSGDSGWPEHLVRLVAAESVSGPALINALRVEPDLGSPARGGIPATTAVRSVASDGSAVWRITGHKIYSTGSHGLRWMAVWGATAADDPDGQRVGAFLVPADRPGIEIRDTWDHLGMRASASNDVVFHDVEIPLDHAIDLQPPTAIPVRPGGAAVLGWMSALISAVYQGVAVSARDWLVGYLGERVPSNLGASLATLPRFQAAVGEIEVMLHTNARLLADLVGEIDAGGARAEAAGASSSATKVVVARNVISAVELALSLIGNPGLSYHHPLQRHYRNALCSRIHTPQDDAVFASLGRAALLSARSA